MVTHPGARYAGPIWLALEPLLYLGVRRRAASVSSPSLPGRGAAGRRRVPARARADEARTDREEMVATAVALAKERGARWTLFVIVVPLDQELDAPLYETEEQASASLAEAVLLGEENGVQVEPVTVRRARSAGDRRAGRRPRLRPDRRRLLAALAPAVRLLLADGRLRAPQRPRGARRRVPRRVSSRTCSDA